MNVSRLMVLGAQQPCVLEADIGGHRPGWLSVVVKEALPPGTAVEVDAGGRTYLGEVTSCREATECGYTVELAIEHALADTPMWDLRASATRSPVASNQPVILPETPVDDDRDACASRIISNPDLFARLLQLTEMRNPESGGHLRCAFASAVGEETTERVLRFAHEATFVTWINLSLEEQKAELDAYFSRLAGHRRSVIMEWLRAQPYLRAVPETANDPQRAKFLSDMEVIAELFRARYQAGTTAEEQVPRLTDAKQRAL